MSIEKIATVASSAAAGLCAASWLLGDGGRYALAALALIITAMSLHE